MVGIDAQNKNILDKQFICPICSLILSDPVQLITCGHRICQSCFQCAQCQKETPQNQVTNYFHNSSKFLILFFR